MSFCDCGLPFKVDCPCVWCRRAANERRDAKKQAARNRVHLVDDVNESSLLAHCSLAPEKQDSNAHQRQQRQHTEIQISVCDLAGSLLVEEIRISTHTNVADAKRKIAKQAAFTHGEIVKNLSAGETVLCDNWTLQDAGLVNGDLVLATRSNRISGKFAEEVMSNSWYHQDPYPVHCVIGDFHLDGSAQIKGLAAEDEGYFSDDCDADKPYEFEVPGPNEHEHEFKYTILSEEKDEFGTSLVLDLMRKPRWINDEEEVYPATMYVNHEDLEDRRLICPQLDLDLMDIRMLRRAAEAKRWQKQQNELRLQFSHEEACREAITASVEVQSLQRRRRLQALKTHGPSNHIGQLDRLVRLRRGRDSRRNARSENVHKLIANKRHERTKQSQRTEARNLIVKYDTASSACSTSCFAHGGC